jgi:hypothetical protein
MRRLWILLLCAGCARAMGGDATGHGLDGGNHKIFDGGSGKGDGGSGKGGAGDGGSGGGGDAGVGGNNDAGVGGSDAGLGGGDLAISGGAPDLPSSKIPCTHGAGFVAWRFHYDQNSTSSILDVYGLPDSSNWEAVAVYPTSIVDSGNGLELGSGNWILIRYSVAGLSSIKGATFSVEARSYSTGTSGSFNAWSPLYGDDATATDAISVYPYSWTSVDYTGHVQVGDDPGLTGVRLYAGPSSSDLSVHAVELCIDGS